MIIIDNIREDLRGYIDKKNWDVVRHFLKSNVVGLKLTFPAREEGFDESISLAREFIIRGAKVSIDVIHFKNSYLPQLIQLIELLKFRGVNDVGSHWDDELIRRVSNMMNVKCSSIYRETPTLREAVDRFFQSNDQDKEIMFPRLSKIESHNHMLQNLVVRAGYIPKPSSIDNPHSLIRIIENIQSDDIKLQLLRDFVEYLTTSPGDEWHKNKSDILCIGFIINHPSTYELWLQLPAEFRDPISSIWEDRRLKMISERNSGVIYYTVYSHDSFFINYSRERGDQRVTLD